MVPAEPYLWDLPFPSPAKPGLPQCWSPEGRSSSEHPAEMVVLTPVTPASQGHGQAEAAVTLVAFAPQALGNKGTDCPCLCPSRTGEVSELPWVLVHAGQGGALCPLAVQTFCHELATSPTKRISRAWRLSHLGSVRQPGPAAQQTACQETARGVTVQSLTPRRDMFFKARKGFGAGRASPGHF